MNTQPHVVLITAPSEDDQAATLAKSLVEERLVACVNLVPQVRSFYWWEGKVQDDAEQLLICKTEADRIPDLIARVKEIHPYSVPEVIALSVSAGHGPYLRWLTEQVGPSLRKLGILPKDLD